MRPAACGGAKDTELALTRCTLKTEHGKYDANYEKATVRKQLFFRVKIQFSQKVKQFFMSLHNSKLREPDRKDRDRSSEKERKGNALASGADEGRDKLR